MVARGSGERVRFSVALVDCRNRAAELPRVAALAGVTVQQLQDCLAEHSQLVDFLACDAALLPWQQVFGITELRIYLNNTPRFCLQECV